MITPTCCCWTREGAAQNVSWWNSFYLCPAYEKTVTYTEELVRSFMRDWGFAGLKIDGQHLNAVAPCFNPAHHHARPEESVEKLQDFMHAIYRTATPDQSGSGHRMVPVRHLVLVLQLQFDESGTGLGSGVVLAGASSRARP